MAKSILVAGGAGYIGSHVCKALASGGYNPVVLDNFSTGYREFVQWGNLVEGSVDDRDIVAATLKKYDICAVIDLSGSIEVSESITDPLKYYENNFARKIPFLKILKDHGIKAFVFSSTAAAYGEPDSVPIQETQKTQPKNPYGWSKLFFEQMLKDFHAAGGPAWAALRYFNACGASPDKEIGEAHDPETHLIPIACMASLGSGKPLKVFGTDYPTPDGTAIRDYVHVMDLAEAHVLAVNKLLEKPEPFVCNLGNGKGISIRDIIASFERLGFKLPYELHSRREGDPARLIADNSRAKEILGWTPQYSDIDTIILSAYNWHKMRHNQQ
ncbi:MAG: UDP-glucose 4-epimerase GalE [Micavibrio aeruginosavorus]|uniref:UDP-glucose 4-epimerase n=1 Tax=Micavibrio aeruginosavorus TaxID=349221 RepID=A0A2W5FIZ7_9BACT|nr:MAG: UDP-glucose 4-epimerase GalE [Micavibrio aeruginosavorus]